MNTPNLSTKELGKVTEENETTIEFDLRLRKFFNNTELTKVLKSIGMNDRKMKKFNFLDNSSDKNFDLPNDSPDRRHSLELITQAKDSQSLFHDIMVDFRFGNPTWEQFIDVTYDVGNEYDIKIIIFENDYSKIGYPNVPGDECVIEDLVNINNKCGVKTYLVKARGLIKYLFKAEKGRIDYSLINGPYGDDADTDEPVLAEWESPQKLPTKKEVQISEFWLGYYWPQWCVGRPSDDNDVIVDWTPGYSLYRDMETKASWNDSGFFIDLSGETGSEAIKWIWKNKKSIFEEAYPGIPISLKTEDEQPKSISVRISEIPMTELLEMNPEDKWHYGQKVYDAEHNFVEIAQEAIDHYVNMTKSTRVTASS